VIAQDLDEKVIERLERVARQMRRDIVKMVGLAGSGHPGGALSAADIVCALYFYFLAHRPDDPRWPERDRFVLSKGHACPVLYAALAEAAYFDRDELWKLRTLGAILQGHPDSTKTPGVEVSSGSLGQGLAVANGMALANRLDGRDSVVVCMLGDGECQEGEVWEAAMFAAHHRLDRVIAIVDNNGLQIDGRCDEVICLGDIADKLRSFGWDAVDIDGHDFGQIIGALKSARDAGNGRPQAIVARTVKGKGVSFMENNVDFHGKAPSKEEVEQALLELAEPVSASGVSS
jgi:transketolase